MKAYLTIRVVLATSILFLLLILSGCSATRYLNDNEALVRRVRIKGIEPKFAEQAALYVQQDIRPNSRLNLALYNLLNTKNGKYRTDRIRNIGEAPHILDTPLVEISTKEIQKFLFYKGFFNAKVENQIQVKRKKAYITFIADMGPAFTIRNFSYQIADTAVKALYEENRPSFTRISEGSRFDNDSLKHESQQIYNLLKRNGYYDYLQQYVRFVTDTGLQKSQADLHLILENPAGRKAHKIYTVNNTHIFIRNSDGKINESIPNTVDIDSQYFYRDYSRRFEPKPIVQYIYINKGERYNVNKTAITYDRLYDLNVFRTIKIDYAKNPDSVSLNATIDMVPLKRMSNRIEGEYTFNTGRNGFNLGNTYTNRNLFRGVEQLDIKFRYGILFDTRTNESLWNRVFNRDFQIGVNLIIPKLLVPFKIPPLGINGVPRTTLSSSLQIFDQPGAFYNRLFINSITYNWLESRFKLHSLTPLNIEYRDGRIDPVFRRELEAKGYEYFIRTNNRQYFNLGSIYNYTFNAARLNEYANFWYFRGLFETAGNSISLLSNLFNSSVNGDNNRTFLSLPYLQYAKTDLDFRKYFYLGGERQFVGRFNPGIVLPYGNTDARELPFERNFFTGGTTGIRAWQARTLGPGNYNRASLQNNTIRRNLTNLDQFGEIKLVGNLEYRYKILNNFFGAKVKGANFTDFGNVWRLREIPDVPGGEFKFNSLLNQIAIGAGAGLRFDLEYFVFRFDVGFKIKDPQFAPKDQWVIKHLFRSEEFKSQYAITNSPDVYRFVQYNFGIGMPF